MRIATKELRKRKISLPFLAKGLDHPLPYFLIRPLPFQNKLVILKRFNNKILNTQNILRRTKEEGITAKTVSIYVMPGCHFDSTAVIVVVVITADVYWSECCLCAQAFCWGLQRLNSQNKIKRVIQPSLRNRKLRKYIISSRLYKTQSWHLNTACLNSKTGIFKNWYRISLWSFQNIGPGKNVGLKVL